MAATAVRVKNKALTPEAAKAKYADALRDAEAATEIDPSCAGGFAWSAILVVKAAANFSETIKSALKIRDRAQAGATADPTDPVPRFILGVFATKGASLSWVERNMVSMLFGGDMSATYKEADAHLRAALRLWEAHDGGAAIDPLSESPGWQSYMPASPWRTLLISAAKARIRCAEAEGTSVHAAKEEARALLRRAEAGPMPTADESIEADKELAEVKAMCH
jgi:hypothetical protein